MDIKYINDSFVNGFIPNCLFYNASPEYNMSIDINKIQYNKYYQSFDFFENKFPKGYDNITGFSEVIQDMASNAEKNNINPLDELNIKLNNLNIDNGINTNISE